MYEVATHYDRSKLHFLNLLKVRGPPYLGCLRGRVMAVHVRAVYVKMCVEHVSEQYPRELDAPLPAERTQDVSIPSIPSIVVCVECVSIVRQLLRCIHRFDASAPIQRRCTSSTRISQSTSNTHPD